MVLSTFIESCSHHHYLNREHFCFHHCEKKPQSLLIPLTPWLLATTNLLSASIDVPLLVVYIDGIIQPVAFCIWLLLLSMFSRFIHIYPLSRPNNISLNSYTTFFLCIYHLAILFFDFLYNASTNIYRQDLGWHVVWKFFIHYRLSEQMSFGKIANLCSREWVEPELR